MAKNCVKKRECGGGDNTRKRYDVNPYLCYYIKQMRFLKISLKFASTNFMCSTYQVVWDHCSLSLLTMLQLATSSTHLEELQYWLHDPYAYNAIMYVKKNFEENMVQNSDIHMQYPVGNKMLSVNFVVL